MMKAHKYETYWSVKIYRVGLHPVPLLSSRQNAPVHKREDYADMRYHSMPFARQNIANVPHTQISFLSFIVQSSSLKFPLCFRITQCKSIVSLQNSSPENPIIHTRSVWIDLPCISILIHQNPPNLPTNHHQLPLTRFDDEIERLSKWKQLAGDFLQSPVMVQLVNNGNQMHNPEPRGKFTHSVDDLGSRLGQLLVRELVQR